jgi:preprotein translocase subunit YajC
MTGFAYAQAAPGAFDYLNSLIVPTMLIIGIMYFLMIRPQQKRRREAMQMQSALAPGDEIVTIGGMHATVVSIDGDVVTVEIAPGVNVRYARPAIARVVKPSTAEAEEPPARAEQPEIQSPIIETRKSTD